MRSTPSGRARGSSLVGSTVLGSVNWAFVITLLLLLVFIFMWFTAADDRDKVRKELVAVTADNAKLLKEGNALVLELDATSKIIGFSGPPPLTFGGQQAQTVDRTKALAHLQSGGEVEVKDEAGNVTKVPGMLNMLRNLQLKMLQSVRSGSGVAAADAKEVDFTWMSQAFKTKLKETNALREAVPAKPAQPADPDNPEAMAKYRADLAAYTAAVEAYSKAMSELSGPEYEKEWKPFKETIAGMPFDPDTNKEVIVAIGPKITGNELSNYEALMGLFEVPFRTLMADYKANKEADIARINEGRSALAAANAEIENQKKRYDELQTTTSGELKKKQDELTAESNRATQNEAAARKAENDLAVMTKESKSRESTLTAKVGAMEARISGDKEQRDLEIRRDDTDGTLLAVSMSNETGTISLGSNAKVYPGLKFAVSYMDRGGRRQTIGEVQVIRVTGPNSSQVRILSSTEPFAGGNFISNPLFNASRPIHIYNVGWTPDLIQQRRLDEMGVVVDARPTAGTDYFVVPDDMKGGGAPAPKEGEEPPAEGASVNQLDKVKQEAHTFGATVITRRMLESFLRL